MAKSDKNLTKATIALFWSHARRYPRLVWPLLAVIPVTVFIGNFVLPFITAQILDRLSCGDYDTHHVWTSFGPLLILFAVLSMLAGVVLWRLVDWFTWSLETRVVRDINQ